jgi:hypothetical protein
MELETNDSLALLDGQPEIWYPRGMSKKDKTRSDAGQREKGTVSTAKSYSSPSKTGRPSKGDLQIIGTKLPVGYLRLLDEEARRIGMGRRELLLLLHQRRVGELIVERPPTAPKPTLAVEELQQVKPYNLSLTPEQRKSVDAERLRVGIPSIAMYIIVLVCDWLGLQVYSPSQAATVGVGDDTSS